MHKVRTIRRDFLVLPSLTSFKMSFNISLYSSNMSLSTWRKTHRRCRFWSSWSCHHELHWEWHKCTCSRCGLATCVKTYKKVVCGIIMLPVCVSRFNLRMYQLVDFHKSWYESYVIRSPQSPTSVVPSHYHSTNAPYQSSIHGTFAKRNKRPKLWNLP